MVKFLSLFLVSAVAVAGQDTDAPWYTSVKTARETALKEGKPCIIVMQVDARIL